MSAHESRRYAVWVAIALFGIGYLILLFTYVLAPPPYEPAPRPRVKLVPFGSTMELLAGTASPVTKLRLLGGNCVLLAPLVVIARALRLDIGLRTAVLALFSASLSIEVYQLLQNAGRFFDVDDLMLNTLGGLAVYLILYRVWPGPVSLKGGDMRGVDSPGERELSDDARVCSECP